MAENETKDATIAKHERETKRYQVLVLRTFTAQTTAGYRHRAGLAIPVSDEGYVGELTDDQLKAIKADTYLTVKPVKG